MARVAVYARMNNLVVACVWGSFDEEIKCLFVVARSSTRGRGAVGIKVKEW